MASQPLVTGGKIIALVKSLFSTSGAYPRILKAHLALLAKWTILSQVCSTRPYSTAKKALALLKCTIF